MSTELKFIKIQGNGNDFVLLNDLQDQLHLKPEQIQFLCDRRIGIGADGLLMIKPATEEYDFRMLYFNADGGRVDFCGNGGRCISYAAAKVLQKNDLRFLADDGSHVSFVNDETGEVSLEMIPWQKLESPELGELFSELHIPVKNIMSFHTGVPHLVIELSGVDESHFNRIPVPEWGATIRRSGFYRDEGINVNFTIHGNISNELLQRTYERGVEAETLSCGTGSVAVALYWKELGNSDSFKIHTPGGTNFVHFPEDRNPVLSGMVTEVFKGTIKA